MPYEIRKEGDQHCLYKKDDNKKIACHDTEDGAKKQMMAIAASENKKTLERYTQEAVAYTQVSMTPGEMCANCRWFIGVNQGGNACHIIDTFPLDIEPTGYCNKHESIETAIAENEMPMMQEMGMDTQGGIISTGNTNTVTFTFKPEDIQHAHDEPAEMDSVYIAPDSNHQGIFKALVQRLQRGMKPLSSVIKGADGSRYMLIITSNSYEDRVKETITTDALKLDVNRFWPADDLYVSDNPLLFWHHPIVEMGEIVFSDVRGPFLVELAKENHAPLSGLLFDYVEAHPEEDNGASHRFAYFKKDRTEDKSFKRIFKRETSYLPRVEAANLLTWSGVLPMTDKRAEYFDKMLGLEGAMETLETKGINALVEELNARGIQHKSAEKPVTDTVADVEKTFGKLVTALIDSQSELMERQDALESGVGTSSKSLTDETTALKEQVKALTAKIEAMQVQLDQRPRSATRASETEIQDTEKEAALKQQFTKRDPFFGVEVKE